MTDASPSGNAPSTVVCSSAKLGHLSPSMAAIAAAAAAAAAAATTTTARISSSPSPQLPPTHPPRQNQHFKSTTTASSVESFGYDKSSPSSDQYPVRAHYLSEVSCIDGRSSRSDDIRQGSDCNEATFGEFSTSSSPAYRHCYQEIDYRQSAIYYRDRFYRAAEMKGDDERTQLPFFQQTALGSYSAGRTSPYLDQGYHTLVSPSPPGWLTPSKYKKVANKCSYMERMPDMVLLQIFSWLSTNELCSVSRVCRRWHNLAWEHSLWKTIILHGEGTCADKAVRSILRRLCGHGQSGLCSSVKQLFVCDGATITDKGLTSLSRRCVELTHVQLQNCATLTDSAVSELVTRCPNIQRLDLTGCSLVSCINVIAGPDLPQKLLLQHLDLTDCISVQDSSLRNILRNCPLLTYLYLRRCYKITDAGMKFIPSFCSSLRELSVSDCHLVTDFALYELAKLGSNLRYLSVAKCGQVSDVGLKVIAKRCYKLRYLNVRGCEAVSDDALTALARSCPRLRSLDIGKCDVSDAGLKVLAENCPNLKKLSLRNCDLVTDRGIQYVCYYCRGLQQLNIQDCQISMEGYKAVKTFCKRCIIEHTNPGFF